MEYLKDNDKYFIRLLKDENLFEQLGIFAEKEKLSCGHLSGIGALKNCELGFYHLEQKHYDKKMFENEAELLSLDGNLSLLEGKPFFHIHTVLGGADFNCYGGHLFNADIAVTAEIYFRPFDAKIERLKDEGIGLNLLSMCGINHG